MKLGVLIAVALAAQVFAAEERHRISGITMEVSSGTADVTVILCDQKTGQPVLAEMFVPFLQGKFEFPPKLITTVECSVVSGQWLSG